MQINIDNGDGLLIKSYEPGKIIIQNLEYNDNLIITPQKIIPHWQLSAIDQLTTENFLPIIELEPELVILGTGETQIFPPPHTLQEFYTRHIGVEIMNTRAACRTYNLLMAEGRRVAAGLVV